jgi:iron complex transport system ATP-binding protein
MLCAREVTMAAGDRILCSKLNLRIEPGEVLAVLGRNGSGKTMFLHTLAGVRRPQCGAVELDARPLADHSRRALGRRIGVLPQFEDQAYWGTVREYVMLGRYPHVRSPFGLNARDEAAVDQALTALEIDALAGRTFPSLSGGERQRARIAQLWAQDPQFMLLDEPLQHLDLQHQLQFMELVRRAARDGKAAMLVLHDLAWAGRCDRVVLFFGDGRYACGSAAGMLEAGRLEELYGCPLQAYGNGSDRHFLPVI